MPRRAVPLLLSLMMLWPVAARGAPVSTELSPPPQLTAPAPIESITVDDEDTVVIGEMLIEGETRHFDDDVIVAPGGHLIVRDATIVFDVAPGTHPALQVAPGGALTIERSVLTNDALPGEDHTSRLSRYWGLVALGSTTIVESDLSYLEQITVNVGPFTIEGSTVRDTWHSGIHVRRTVLPVVIRDNVVTRNHFRANGFGGAIYLTGTRGAIVEGNVVHDALGTGIICSQSSTVGSYVWPDDVRIAGNLVYGGILEGTASMTAYLDGGTDGLRIEDNAFVTASVGLGTAYDSEARVRRNTITGVRVPGGPAATVGVVAFNVTNNGRANQGGLPAFRDNVVSGVRTALQSQESGRPVVDGNALLGTTNGLLQMGAGGAIDPSPEAQITARGNWWGSSDGPSDSDAADGSSPSMNAGSGARAFGNIDYSDWATESRDARLLSVTAPSITLGPGERVDVPVTVTNRSVKTAVAEVWTFNAPPGWTIDAPLAVGVEAGGSTTVLVTVKAPADAAAGSLAELVVGAKGTNLVAASADVIAATVS